MHCIILCGGRARRMGGINKSMIRILGKPLLEYTITSLKTFGFENITIIVGKNKEEIINYFKDGEAFGAKIKYIEQKQALGTAHAIYLTKGLFQDAFLVILGDVLFFENLREIYDYHLKENATATICVERTDKPEKTGIVEIKHGKIVRAEEKPKKPFSNIGIAGIYVFENDIYKAIEKTKPVHTNELEITTSINILARDKKVVPYFIKNPRVNINTPRDVLRAEEIVKSLSF